MKFLLLGSQVASLVNFRGPLIRELIRQGHTVTAVAPDPVEPWLSQLKEMGAQYIEAPLARTGINPLADLKLTYWLWRMFRAQKPDVLLAFHAKPVIYGGMAATLARVKRRTAMIEGLGQGFAIEAPTLGRKLVRFVMPLLYRLGLCGMHLVFFLNADDEAEFRARGLIKKQHVVQLPGIGIDLAHFAQQPLPAGAVTFLLMARLLVEKGVRDYAAAAEIVKATHPEARFLLLGQPEHGKAGVPLHEVGQFAAIEYVGETSDVRPFLAACHVFVLPTYYREGLPRSILEAMATGRPILTTSAPGARETVVAGANGYLVESRNPKALAQGMLQFIAQPEKLNTMGQASRALAEQRYEVGNINRQIITALMHEAGG